MAEIKDEAFEGVGLEGGLEIWRIEKFKLNKIDKSEHGRFNKGDSYLILQTRQSGRSLNHEIFFWIGSTSTKVEFASVAYKAVELDNVFGGACVQHREVQDAESKQFLSLFHETGFQIVDADIESGFRQIKAEDYDAKLLHVKGVRNVRVRRVNLLASSLNHGDVFILDCGRYIYLWLGAKASKPEKAKGFDVANKIHREWTKDNAFLQLLEDGKTDRGEDAQEFWDALGGTFADVKSIESAGSDEEYEQTKLSEVVLYNLGQDGSVKEVTNKLTNSSLLQSEEAYLIDAGTEAFLWLGRRASTKLHNEIFEFGQNALTQLGKDPNTALTRVLEGCENLLFKELFVQWVAPKLPKPTKTIAQVGQVAGKEIQQKIELPSERIAEEFAVNFDQGSMQLEAIYQIVNFNKEPVPKELWGIFYNGDSYIVVARFKQKNLPREAIYFWQGEKSTTDERGASAILTKEMSTNYPRGSQIRVVEGKETADFLALLAPLGGLIVRQGGVPAGWTNQKNIETDEQKADKSLFRIHGTSQNNIRAFETQAVTSSLNSRDPFVLLVPDFAFLWIGQFSLREERESANIIAQRLQSGRQLVTLTEGMEATDQLNYFFEQLGGEGYYTTDGGEEQAEQEEEEPRFFRCYITGVVKFYEIQNYAQSDLESDSVFVLDTGKAIFVWIGKISPPELKNHTQEIVEEYAKRTRKLTEDGLQAKDLMIFVDEFNEPSLFTSYFPKWFPRVEEEGATLDPYEQRKERLLAENEERRGRIQDAPILRHVDGTKVGDTLLHSASKPSDLPVIPTTQSTPIKAADKTPIKEPGSAGPKVALKPVVTKDTSSSNISTINPLPPGGVSKEPVAAAGASKFGVQLKSTSLGEKLKTDPSAAPEYQGVPVENKAVETTPVKQATTSATKTDAVDQLARMNALSDSEFEKAFGTPRDKFNKLQKWKQDDARKKAGFW